MKGTLAQELDFVNEGRNSEKCQSDLKHLDYLYVPKVHWDKTSTVSFFTINILVITGGRSCSRGQWHSFQTISFIKDIFFIRLSLCDILLQVDY